MGDSSSGGLAGRQDCASRLSAPSVFWAGAIIANWDKLSRSNQAALQHLDTRMSRPRPGDQQRRPDQVVEFSIATLDGGAELTTPEAFIRDVFSRVERTSGVLAAGIAAPPAFASFTPRAFRGFVRAAGGVDRPYLDATRRHVSGGYFAALGIPMVAGRTFTADEYTSNSRKDTSAGVIVSANLARLLFGGVSVVRPPPDGDDDLRCRDQCSRCRDHRRRRGHAVGLGLPARRWAGRLRARSREVRREHVYVRSTLAPAEMERQLRDVMRGVEPRMPLRDVMTLREEFDALFPEDRTIAGLMRLVAGLAFALGLFGVASVMACTLAERTRELGIRAALGASSGRLTRDVLRPALVSGLAGIVIGLVLFALMSRGLASHVHGVSALDPATLAAAAAVLLAASLAAAWVPTRRAARTDPTITLRAE